MRIIPDPSVWGLSVTSYDKEPVRTCVILKLTHLCPDECTRQTDANSLFTPVKENTNHIKPLAYASSKSTMCVHDCACVFGVRFMSQLSYHITNVSFMIALWQYVKVLPVSSSCIWNICCRDWGLKSGFLSNLRLDNLDSPFLVETCELNCIF